jgi:hypothetical protein
MVTVQHVFPLKNEIKNGFAVGNFQHFVNSNDVKMLFKWEMYFIIKYSRRKTVKIILHCKLLLLTLLRFFWTKF